MFDLMFDRVFDSSILNNQDRQRVGAWDYGENDKSYLVSASLPGIPQQNIKIHISDGRLFVSAAQAAASSSESPNENTNEKSEKIRWHCRERTSGAFKGSFKLPANADVDGEIEAIY